jgi:hypothetical protein
VDRGDGKTRAIGQSRCADGRPPPKLHRSEPDHERTPVEPSNHRTHQGSLGGDPQRVQTQLGCCWSLAWHLSCATCDTKHGRDLNIAIDCRRPPAAKLPTKVFEKSGSGSGSLCLLDIGR